MSNFKQICLIEEAIGSLSKRAERLRAGEELCKYNFNGSDWCYETYCEGCGKHLRSLDSQLDIPFKKDALCCDCAA